MESNLVLGKSNENSVYDIEKFIICHEKTKTRLTSTENYRQNIIDAANKRRDERQHHREAIQISHDK